MMSAHVVTVLLIVLTAGNYRLSRSVLYPPFVFCAVWVFVLLLYAADLEHLGELHTVTLSLITFGAIFMSAGGGAAMLLPEALMRLHVPALHPKQTRLIRIILLFVIGVGIAFIARRTIVAAGQGVGSAFLERARNAMFEETGPIPIYTYALPWSIFASVMFCIERRDWSAWAMIFLSLAGSIVGTGRVTLLQLIAALTCVSLLMRDQVTVSAAFRVIRWPLLAFLVLWIGLIFTTKDTTVFGQMTVGNTVVLFLVGYIVGPVVGLDYVLGHGYQYADVPHHTFKFFLTAASALHLIQYTPPPLFDEFAPMPFPTNVYSVYKFYYTDFGLLGTLAVMAFIGFLQTALYKKARTKSVLAVYLFSLSMFPLIMVFFDDLYSAFGVLLDTILFGCAYLLLSHLRFTWLPMRKQSSNA
jgi:oligosaccharide repeat unit polymerase